MTTCTYCCGNCGRHFHSLTAFDAHRVGSHSAPRGSEERRRCLAPIEVVDKHGEARLVALTEHGECRMLADVKHDVTIWTMAGYDKVRRVFEGERRGATRSRKALRGIS